MSTAVDAVAAGRGRRRLVPVLVLVAAVLALIGSAVWVAARADDGPWGGEYEGQYWPGMMMGGRSGPTYGIPGDGQPVTTLESARARAQLLADQLDDGLRAAEVMQFASNFYVELVDTAGHGA